MHIVNYRFSKDMHQNERWIQDCGFETFSRILFQKYISTATTARLVIKDVGNQKKSEKSFVKRALASNFKNSLPPGP